MSIYGDSSSAEAPSELQQAVSGGGGKRAAGPPVLKLIQEHAVPILVA